MSMSFRIDVDKKKIEATKLRLAVDFPKVRAQLARRAAEFVKHEAVLNAPHDTGELRRSADIIDEGNGASEVFFERTAPWKDHEDFDVALWTHDGFYNPSDPDPRVGRRYLARAYEENQSYIEDEIIVAGMRTFLDEMFSDDY